MRRHRILFIAAVLVALRCLTLNESQAADCSSVGWQEVVNAAGENAATIENAIKRGRILEQTKSQNGSTCIVMLVLVDENKQLLQLIVQISAK